MNEILYHLIIVLVVLFGALTFAGGLIWVERRLLALFQDRWARTASGRSGCSRASRT